jgi:hypothetical protein
MNTSLDNDTIGLLLCKGKNGVLDYAFKGYRSAMGVADYQISKVVPEVLKSLLPQIEALEKAFKDMP